MKRFQISTLFFLMIVGIRAETPEGKSATEKPGIQFSGALQGDFRLTLYPETQRPQTMSDLYLRRAELGLEAELISGISAIAVLNSEWLGDTQNEGSSGVVFDEIHLDVRPPRFPGYLVIGQNTLPFGFFESDLLTDPLTQDAFEIKKVGLSFGINGPMESDLSLTVYKGTELMDRLFGAKLFDPEKVERNSSIPTQANSFICSLRVSPFRKILSLFGGVLSEPGNRSRNATLNLGFHAVPSELSPWMWTGEMMLALRREIYAGAAREYREAVVSTALTYHLAIFQSSGQRGQLRDNGSYRSRRLHRHSHPVSLSLRFECFLDDAITRELSSWTLKNRKSLSGRFTFVRSENIAVYGETEIRHSSYRIPPQTDYPTGRLEWFIRLGVDF